MEEQKISRKAKLGKVGRSFVKAGAIGAAITIGCVITCIILSGIFKALSISTEVVWMFEELKDAFSGLCFFFFPLLIIGIIFAAVGVGAKE